MGTSTEHLHPVLFDRFERMRHDRRFGGHLGYRSTCRSPAEQRRLWRGYVLHLPGYNLAARPGTSPHEIGTRGTPYCHAVDAEVDGIAALEPLVKRVAPEYGLKGTVPSEWWHLELVEDDERHLTVIPPLWTPGGPAVTEREMQALADRVAVEVLERLGPWVKEGEERTRLRILDAQNAVMGGVGSIDGKAYTRSQRLLEHVDIRFGEAESKRAAMARNLRSYLQTIAATVGARSG